MVNKLVWFILTLTMITLSCKKNQSINSKIVYNENGSIKEKWIYGRDILDSINIRIDDLKNINIDSAKLSYFEKPKNQLGLIEFYFDNRKYDLIFYSNGGIDAKGYSKENMPIGKWKKYSVEGDLNIIEFTSINGISYKNQIWSLDKAMDTIGGSYFNLTYRDTIELSEDLKLLVSVPISYYENRITKIMACIPTDNSPDFNNDYSNKSEINQACSYDIETSEVNKKNVFVDNYNRAAVIQKKFKTSGRKLVRGIIYEYLVKEKDSLGLDKALENAHKMYFEIPVYVKDNV